MGVASFALTCARYGRGLLTTWWRDNLRMSDRGHMCTCHMTLILMYVIYVMPFFHFAEWVGLMVYKFPVKYSSLEDVVCSNHYHS